MEWKRLSLNELPPDDFNQVLACITYPTGPYYITMTGSELLTGWEIYGRNQERYELWRPITPAKSLRWSKRLLKWIDLTNR